MIQSPHKPPAEQVLPLPPRYKWLKRFLKAGGMVLVGLVLLRWWWGHEAHRRLQTEIDRIQARGEPIFPEDFDPPEEIPDDQNAALALIKAAQQITSTAEQDEIINGLVKLPDITQDQWKLIADFEEKNRAALDLVRNARLMSKVDWGVRFRSPTLQVTNAITPNLSLSRQLCRVLCAVAVRNHHAGNDTVAFDTLRDVFFLSKALDQMPSLISRLTANAIDDMAVSRIEYCTPDLIVYQPGGADHSLVDAVIADLLDEEALRDALRRAMRADRMFQLDSVELIVGGRLGPSALTWAGAAGPASGWERAVQFPVKPLYKVDAVLLIQDMDQIIQACGQSSWPEAYEILGPLDETWEELFLGSFAFRRQMSMFQLRTQGRVVYIHFLYLAQRRMAAVALAIRLYEVDHGRRPGALAELAPDYLDAVPPDPMSTAGASFRYLPDAETPILYSVGENGVDDGGLVWDEKRNNYDRYRRDLVFLLDGKLPDPPR